MNGMDVILSLQFIGDDLIENAEFAQLPAGIKQPHKSIRRPLLAAALIAVLLLLVGCAVAVVTSIFGSPKEMISALYGRNTGFDSAPPTEVSDPWKPDSTWTVPGYEKQPVEDSVAKELEKQVSPVGSSIEANGNKLTVDAFIYDSVTQSGLITMLLEHPGSLDPGLQNNGQIGYLPVEINQYGWAYLIPEKTTDSQLAFTYYFRMDKRHGDNLSVAFPDFEERISADALEALRSEEIPKIRQRLLGELTAEEAAAKCMEIYGFSGYTGEYDDYYFLAASEFDTAHAEEAVSQYQIDMAAIEQSLKETLTPEEALNQLKALWGEELLDETLDGRGQEEARELAYFFLTKRMYDETHTENKIFVPLQDSMTLPNRTFGNGAVLINTLCIRVSAPFVGSNDPKNLTLHMKDGSSFVVRGDATDNTLFALMIEHGDTLFMLNSAVNIDAIESVEVFGRQSSAVLNADG